MTICSPRTVFDMANLMLAMFASHCIPAPSTHRSLLALNSGEIFSRYPVVALINQENSPLNIS